MLREHRPDFVKRHCGPNPHLEPTGTIEFVSSSSSLVIGIENLRLMKDQRPYDRLYITIYNDKAQVVVSAHVRCLLWRCGGLQELVGGSFFRTSSK